LNVMDIIDLFVDRSWALWKLEAKAGLASMTQ
jgi:hypothetical protein